MGHPVPAAKSPAMSTIRSVRTSEGEGSPPAPSTSLLLLLPLRPSPPLPPAFCCVSAGIFPYEGVGPPAAAATVRSHSSLPRCLCADETYRPRVIMGYCDNVKKGDHTIKVYVHDTPGYSGSKCLTGRCFDTPASLRRDRPLPYAVWLSPSFACHFFLRPLAPSWSLACEGRWIFLLAWF